MKKLQRFWRNEHLWLFLILLITVFLYFYHIVDWQYFSYDQARDFLIIKRILVDKKLTLIGPSLGVADGAYLPPFYYYLTAPFLLLSHFHLWGPDILCVFLGIGGILVFYFLAKEMFGVKPVLLATSFYAFNPFIIQAARHIRNPHLLPPLLLIFAFSSRRFLEKPSGILLFCASLSLGVAISLHITAIFFLPILIFLVAKQFRRRKFLSALFSILFCFSFYLPVFFFDLRHNFIVSKAVVTFFAEGESLWMQKLIRLSTFFYKIPLILFSGNYQKELLSLRSLPILPLEKVNFFPLNWWGILKLVFALITIFFIIYYSYKGLKYKPEKKKNFLFVIIFTFLGFGVSLLLPRGYSYFYYFYNLFPFLYLQLAGAFFMLLKKQKGFLAPFVIVFLVIIPLLPKGLRNETRPESYFLPPVGVISKDILEKKYDQDQVVLVSNLADSYRWEKNALEYRYFLEAIKDLKVLGDQVGDYQRANVLYLIDEGALKEPLSLGGMEMEAFGPKKVEKVWQVATGQKIYKLTR